MYYDLLIAGGWFWLKPHHLASVEHKLNLNMKIIQVQGVTLMLFERHVGGYIVASCHKYHLWDGICPFWVSYLTKQSKHCVVFLSEILALQTYPNVGYDAHLVTFISVHFYFYSLEYIATLTIVLQSIESSIFWIRKDFKSWKSVHSMFQFSQFCDKRRSRTHANNIFNTKFFQKKIFISCV